MTNRGLRLLAGLLIVLLPASCGGEEPRQPAPRPQMVHILVDDESCSAYERGVAWAANALKLSLAEAAANDGLVVVLALTNDTAGQSVIPIRVDFGKRPAWVPTDQLFVNNWKQQTQAEALKTFKDWRDKVACTKGTDYIGALLVVDRLLAGRPAGDRQVLFAGDGFQATAAWSMHREHPSRRMCQARAIALRRGGHLGRLHGASVTFIGGGLNSTAALSPDEQADLAACWAELIRQAGGRTSAGWWNPGRFMVKVP
jgi:hypothetical protein